MQWWWMFIIDVWWMAWIANQVRLIECGFGIEIAAPTVEERVSSQRYGTIKQILHGSPTGQSSRKLRQLRQDIHFFTVFFFVFFQLSTAALWNPVERKRQLNRWIARWWDVVWLVNLRRDSAGFRRTCWCRWRPLWQWRITWSPPHHDSIWCRLCRSRQGLCRVLPGRRVNHPHPSSSPRRCQRAPAGIQVRTATALARANARWWMTRSRVNAVATRVQGKWFRSINGRCYFGARGGRYGFAATDVTRHQIWNALKRLLFQLVLSRLVHRVGLNDNLDG